MMWTTVCGTCPLLVGALARLRMWVSRRGRLCVAAVRIPSVAVRAACLLLNGCSVWAPKRVQRVSS